MGERTAYHYSARTVTASECLNLNKVHTKKCPCKNKTVQQTNSISIKQLFKVLSTGTNTCPQPWLPLINDLVDDALLELSPDRN